MKLAIDSLSVARGERIVISDLTFAVDAGDALLLTGPNGAGKTTLMRAIAGFLAPRSGSIRLEGGDEDREIAEQCHYVGHLNGLKGSLSVAENLAFWARYLGRGGPDDESARVERALERLDLLALASIPAAYLSAGQKRRVGLARLIAAYRPVWLLDEPTSSLDAASSAIVASLIEEHAAAGGIVLAATHLPMGVATARELRLGAAAPSVTVGNGGDRRDSLSRVSGNPTTQNLSAQGGGESVRRADGCKSP